MEEKRMKIFKFFAAVAAAFVFVSCDRKIPPQFYESLGTVCFINLYDDGKESVYGEIESCLAKIDSKFNVNNEDSEISLVNKNASKSPVRISDNFAFVLKTSLETAELTDGDFNPALGNLIKLWGINTDHARVPSESEIEEARKHCGWRKIAFDKTDQTVFLRDDKISLDFGAIAKGFAADEIALICERNNVRRAVIDLGGNVLVLGEKKDRSQWKIGIKNPENPAGEPCAVLNFPAISENGKTCSVVTSGVYERFFIQDGKRYHHILSGETGFPAESGLKSITVVCRKSIAADALSTAFFVAGKERALELKNKAENLFGEKISLVFIENDGKISSSLSDSEISLDFINQM